MENQAGNQAPSASIQDVQVTEMDGKVTDLRAFSGQVLLIVNVASRCGFTRQYGDLQTLYQTYQARGFTILGFPCNQFLHQEPGSNDSIRAFAESCFRVTFPLFARIDVRGKEQAPIYAWLASHMPRKPLVLVPWNFTKFLIDAEGNVVRRFLPTAAYDTLRAAVECELEKKEHAKL